MAVSRTHRNLRLALLGIVAVLVGLGVALGGCGGDDDEGGSTTSAAGPAQAEPAAFEDVKPNLEAAGYTVKEESPEPLIRREDGGVVTPEEKLVVTGGELPAGSDVSVYSLSSPKDVAALKDFAGGGVSVVEGSVFYQSSEAGEAEAVAEAARG
jgi:hypothetical protein